MAIFFMAFALVTVGFAPANAPPPEPQQPIDVVGKRDPGQKMVCRMAVSTGSIIPARVCKTAAQRDADTERSVRYKERATQDMETGQQVQELRNAAPRR